MSEYATKRNARITIFVPEEELDLPKEVNDLAKKDTNIDKKKAKNKKKLLSLVTRSLWKSYVYNQKSKCQNQ